MRHTHRAARPAATLLAGILTLAAVLAGCAAPGSRPARPSRTPPSSPLTPGRSHEPPPGSRAEALALARQLLSGLVLPPGARPAQVSPLPQPASSIAVAGSVNVHRVFMLRQSMAAAYSFLMAHLPAGMRRSGDGYGSGPAGVTVRNVTYALRSLSPGIREAGLVVTVVPRSGGSLLRADAQVVWFPPRSAAEHLDAARFHAVTISASGVTPRSRRPHTVTRSVTSPDIISRLAQLLNGLQAAPDGPTSCPMVTASYRLAFAASAASPPDVVVSTDGCATDQISVHGKAQPALWDPAGKLAAAARRLLGLGPQP